MESSYLLLFVSAFLAATILPVSSEVVLASVIAGDSQTVWLPIAIATAGNSAGAAVNWALGRFCMRFVDRKWFPLTPRQHEKASGWFQRFGIWSLLFAWVPVVGDPLTVVAGLLRVPVLTFLVLVTIGKAARYFAVTGAVLGLL